VNGGRAGAVSPYLVPLISIFWFHLIPPPWCVLTNKHTLPTVCRGREYTCGTPVQHAPRRGAALPHFSHPHFCSPYSRRHID
jgi:hypothetical protein